MSDLFSKHLKKQSVRAKEKLLESLGKADRTTDDIFEEHNANFLKQQKAAERMHKDVKNYVTCVKALALASKALHETLRDVYEPEWPNRPHVLASSQSYDLQWDEYQEKLNEKVLNPLVAYNAHFAELKTKIAKRGRKLVDFDSARHGADALKASSKKGVDDAKLQKAQAELVQAEKMYKDLNDELLDELPAFYDSRITFLVENLQALFNSESVFHSEASKRISDASNGDAGKNPFDESDESERESRRSSKDEEEPVAKQSQSPPNTTVKVEKDQSHTEEKKTDGAKVLYKVRATHRYAAEDTDELSFEAGEVITVVVPDVPEDLDEGWLCGIKESDGAKGVFPANFTKQI